MTDNRKAAPQAPAVLMPYGQLPAPQTLAELRAQILQANDLPPRVRADIAAGIKAFQKHVPEVEDLRPLGSVLHPLYHRLRAPGLGLDPAYCSTIISNVRRGLEWRYSVEKGVSHRIQPISNRWASIWRQLRRGSREKWTLSRFVRWCDRAGIAPAVVDDRTLIGFGEYVATVGATRRARHYQWIVVSAWNTLAETMADWPKRRLTMPSEGGPTGTTRAAFAPAFLADLERYAAISGGKVANHGPRRRVSEMEDQRRSRRPLAPETIQTRVMALRRGAILLAAARGIELSEITSLAHLVAPGAAPDIVNQYMDEIGEKAPSVRNLAIALRYMAKTMFPADTGMHERLGMLANNTEPQSKQMAQRNVDLLMTITPEDMAALYLFPEQALREVLTQVKEKGRATARTMAVAHVAIAVAILLHAPVRIKNLASIRVGENLLVAVRGKATSVVFESEDVKNRYAIDLSLPTRTSLLIGLYLDKLLPLIKRRPDPQALFPGPNGSRNKQDFGEMISRILERRMGLHLNPHFFRHLAAFTYLMRNPGDYETVRVMLGHKDVDTTRKFYCALEDGPLKAKAQACLAAVAEEFVGGGVKRRLPRGPIVKRRD